MTDAEYVAWMERHRESFAKKNGATELLLSKDMKAVDPVLWRKLVCLRLVALAIPRRWHRRKASAIAAAEAATMQLAEKAWGHLRTPQVRTTRGPYSPYPGVRA